MTIQEELIGVSRLFLDTAPIIYYVEENSNYLPMVDVIFEQIASRALVAVTSPVTFAECFVIPYRVGKGNAQQQFVELIVEAENINLVGKQAVELRDRYNLQLADALQVATALVEECEAFLINDTELRRVGELRVLVVGELEV